MLENLLRNNIGVFKNYSVKKSDAVKILLKKVENALKKMNYKKVEKSFKLEK